MLTYTLFIVGFYFLIKGADWLIEGASSVAKKFKVSNLMIGLTVVSFGTSAPELVVNILASFKGSSDIAIGNIIGSNIANILLILGLAAIIYPLTIKGNTVWKEIPFAFLAMVLVYVMGNDALFDGAGYNAITRTDGFSLIAMFAIFMFYVFGIAKTEGKPEEVKVYSWFISSILTLSGLICLFLGGKLLVDNAVILARLAGLSEVLIGL